MRVVQDQAPAQVAFQELTFHHLTALLVEITVRLVTAAAIVFLVILDTIFLQEVAPYAVGKYTGALIASIARTASPVSSVQFSIRAIYVDNVLKVVVVVILPDVVLALQATISIVQIAV